MLLLLRTIFSVLLSPLLLYHHPHFTPQNPEPITHHRRVLRGHHHHPTPPLSTGPSTTSIPPAIPPTQPPSPSFPKHPSSSLPSSSTMPFTSFPFFPSLPSPPPPPAPPLTTSDPSQPTFPANVSALPTQPRSASPSPNLLPTILLPLLSVSLLALLLSLLLLHLRRRRHRKTSSTKNARSDSIRLFPPPPPSTSNPSTEFLYLGTLVSPRGTSQPLDPTTSTDTGGGGAASGGPPSPELRPLPPLPRQLGCSHVMVDTFDGSAPSSVSDPDPANTSVSSSLPTSSSPTRSSKESDTWGGAGRDTELRPPPIPPPPVTLLQRQNPNHQNSNPDPFMQTSDKPRLKPLFWDKVPSSSSKVMAWDRLKSGSFQLNEEMIQSLFGSKTASNNGSGKQFNVKDGVSSTEENLLTMDRKKSQNIAILLKALNISKEKVCESLLEGNIANIGSEVLEALVRMSPTKDEESKLKEYRDDSPFKLGSAEAFIKALIDVPFAFQRVDAMLFMANFDHEVSYLKGSFASLEGACDELRNCRLFHKLLDAVLKTGNCINSGTHRGDAKAFKLDTLLKLANIKSNDGKTTLLHFIIHEVIKSEKLAPQFINSLESELATVKKASTIDPVELTHTVSKLSYGVEKVRNVIQLNKSFLENGRGLGFHDTMSVFLRRAEKEILEIQDQESVTLSSVRDTAEFFHGDSASEESEPFRIFVVVRDFLAILNDKICKEAGKNEFVARNNACQIPADDDSIPSLI